MFTGKKPSEERQPLMSGPKPVYVVPRSNSISQVDVEKPVPSPTQHYPSNGATHEVSLLSSLWPFGGGGGHGRSAAPAHKIRKVPVKVEPKVFFANERTFLAWLNMSITLASISAAILAFADNNEFSQVYGFIVLPVAICFTLYALHTYVRRSAMLRNRMPGPYEDRVGPVVLTVLLVCSILVNMTLKLVDIFSHRGTGEPPIISPSVKGGFKPSRTAGGPI